MRRHWQYLKYVLRHKWFVLVEGVKLGGIPIWTLIFHDWDKFLPDEWFPYARFFYESNGARKQRRSSTGYYKPTDTGDSDFDYAWFLHQKRNKHHWQWWVMPEDTEGVKILRMSEVAIREMVADWKGAGRAQGQSVTLLWYASNYDKLQLHPMSRARVNQILTGWDIYAVEETAAKEETPERKVIWSIVRHMERAGYVTIPDGVET